MLLTTSPSLTRRIRHLRDALDGRVITPEDAAYDANRTIFGGNGRRPAAIVRVANATDVSRVIELARDTGVELAVRGGGHSMAGHGTTDGGIVLDLRDLKAMDIELGGRSAWAEAGLTTGAYTNAAAGHGLATGFGDTGSVGIGGITLGGGVGFLVRKHGLTVDQLLAAEVITADGRLLRVDADTHPDLFWAIRGGGGNFGVATRFRFRLHPLRWIVGGMLLLPATPGLITSLVAQAEAAPEELSVIANIAPAPPMPLLPADCHGRPVIMALMVHAGGVEEGERAIAPFRALARPVADTIRPLRYAEMFQPPAGGDDLAMAVRTLFADTVDRDGAEAIVQHLEARAVPMPAVQLRVLGGAMARVPDQATAFAHRRRRVMVTVAAMYGHAEEAAIHQRWATGLAASLQRGKPGAYVNFMAEEAPARVRQAHPGSTWDRLVSVKRRYDPTNLFRRNQNVPPADGR
jgi:FAD/FMN-containing dehydrogenase